MRLFFESWRNFILKLGTKFWLAVRKSRISAAQEFFQAWKKFLVLKLRKRLVTQKVTNLVQKRLHWATASRAIKAWVQCTQISHWFSRTLAVRSIRGLQIFRLRRKNKEKRLMIAGEMFKAAKLREVMELILGRGRENQAARLRLAVGREEDRLKTLARTLAIWRVRVVVRKSFRI